MGFVTSIMIGLALGILVGIIPGILSLIPFFGPMIAACNCLLTPLFVVVGGYLVGSIGKIRAGDWGGLALQNFVYAFTAAITGAVVNTLLTLFNISTAIGAQQDILGIGVTAAGGIVGIIMLFFVGLVVNLVFGFVGGAIYLVTARK
ncbi:MAG: hypothetical protein N3G76_03085 [Candidatus Micrarchaeota archaeon]|nr:hypothetical protein [Candidatus Micrarchaeota archaeon]